MSEAQSPALELPGVGTVTYQVLNPGYVEKAGAVPMVALVGVFATFAEANSAAFTIPGAMIVQNVVIHINPKAAKSPILRA